MKIVDFRMWPRTFFRVINEGEYMGDSFIAYKKYSFDYVRKTKEPGVFEIVPTGFVYTVYVDLYLLMFIIRWERRAPTKTVFNRLSALIKK